MIVSSRLDAIGPLFEKERKLSQRIRKTVTGKAFSVSVKTTLRWLSVPPIPDLTEPFTRIRCWKLSFLKTRSASVERLRVSSALRSSRKGMSPEKAIRTPSALNPSAAIVILPIRKALKNQGVPRRNSRSLGRSQQYRSDPEIALTSQDANDQGKNSSSQSGKIRNAKLGQPPSHSHV